MSQFSYGKSTNFCAEFLTIDYINLLKFHNYKNGNGNFVYEVGLFRFDKIIPLLKKTKSVYFHTVGNFIKLSPYMYFFSKKKKIIDLHGSQPEELSYSNQNILSNIFSFFEKIAFRKCDYFIHVSHNMISHFKEKYSWHNKPDLYVPIFSSNLDLNKKINIYESSKTSRIQLGINEDEKVFLYSGGIQAWQKVDCVVNFSRKVINSGHTVILLSMQAEFFKDQLSDCLDNPNLIITSAKPEELEKYYLASNFGMMFRDDNVLNVVSSPTKMSEYLYYGIIPVLTSKKV